MMGTKIGVGCEGRKNKRPFDSTRGDSKEGEESKEPKHPKKPDEEHKQPDEEHKQTDDPLRAKLREIARTSAAEIALHIQNAGWSFVPYFLGKAIRAEQDACERALNAPAEQWKEITKKIKYLSAFQAALEEGGEVIAIDDPIEGMEPAVKDDLRATFGRKKGMWMLPAKTKEAPVHLLNPWGKTFEDHHLIRLGILCSTEDGVGDGFIIIDDFDWKIVITKNGTVTFSTDKWIEDYKQM